MVSWFDVTSPLQLKLIFVRYKVLKQNVLTTSLMLLLLYHVSVNEAYIYQPVFLNINFCIKDDWDLSHQIKKKSYIGMDANFKKILRVLLIIGENTSDSLNH